MAQWKTRLVLNFVDLNSISDIYMMEGSTDLPKLTYDLHRHAVACMHVRTYMNIDTHTYTQ